MTIALARSFALRVDPWPTWLGCLTLLVGGGCHSGHYQASNLPLELRAPQVTQSSKMNLARLAGITSGSSQLAPGDLLHLTVLSGLEEEAIPKPARVDEQGQLQVPLVGPVMVAGLDEQQAAEQIRLAAIDRGIYRNPQVTLEVTERAVNHVTVLGAVTNPGMHELPKGASNLMAAVAAAGGFTDEAGTEVEVIRRVSSSLAQASPVDESDAVAGSQDTRVQLASYQETPYSAMGTAGYLSPHLGPQRSVLSAAEVQAERIDLTETTSTTQRDLRLEDQAVVMVHPKKPQRIHVSGLVRKPDQFELPKDQPLHVLDAIALAGGKSSAVADKVFVIRRLDEQTEPQVIELSISRAKTHGDENLRLVPGDLVSVEATVATQVVDALSQVFRITAGVGGDLLSF